MSRSVEFRAAFAAVVVPLLLTVCASTARAQAYLPAKGEGSVSMVYQDVFVKYHSQATTRVDAGPIWSKALLLDVTYGVTDNLAISFGIPWVAAKYEGPSPHPLVDLSGPTPTFYGVTPVDDGTYHQTFQDFRFDIRYNIAKRWMVLTPFIGSTMPSHDYTYFAHAAPGRDQKEFQVGVSGAKLLDRMVPGLFVQGRYAYGVTEKILPESSNRSHFDLELGYFVTPKIRVLALGNAMLTHGGIDMPLRPRFDLPAIEFAHHDQIQRENALNVGAGGAYSLNDKIDLYGSLIHTVAARNGHVVDRGVSLGMSWSFSTRRSKDRAIADRSLAKCMCGKSAS
jgi:hypothetical protein